MGNTYIISDIHGCYAEFLELLDRIALSDEDELFVLGDAMDRGPESIRVLQDLMNRANVTYILGNHDLMFLEVLRRLYVKVSEETLLDLSDDDFRAYYSYVRNGGEETLRQFRRLSPEEQGDLRDYLESCSYFETVESQGKLYVLVHAGLDHFDPEKEMEEYDPHDLVWARPNYEKKYFPGDRIYVVTGHTPTILIREDRQALVYTKNHHIAIDCGCVFGGRLAAYCIDSGEVFYVDSKQPRDC